MIERIIYEADDGTEFDFEEDCLQYEWGLKLGDNIQFCLLGRKKNKLNPKDYTSYEDAWFIFVPNETAFKQLQNAWDGNYIDTCYPPFLWDDVHKYGLWAYDENICREGWYHVGDYLQALQQEADEVLAIINRD
jgi:hypothetical protein